MAARRGHDISIILCILMHGAVLPACAAQAGDRWGGSVALTTDYIYRGVSQSGGQPAIQGGVHIQLPPGWSAGLWGSSVDLNRGAGATYEIDLHAAHAWSLGEHWSARLGITQYMYPNDTAELDYDYEELTASISYQQRVTATLAWSPSISRYGGGAIARDRRATSYELTLLQPLGPRWSVCLGAGHYDLRELFGEGYWFWNAGLTFTWDALQVDLSHIGADETAEDLFGYQASGSRWTAALSWRF